MKGLGLQFSENLNSNEMCLLFTDIFLGIMSKHISNKITCNGKNAPWVTPQVKTSIKGSTRVYSKLVKLGRNPGNYNNVREVEKISSKLINQAKQIY